MYKSYIIHIILVFLILYFNKLMHFNRVFLFFLKKKKKKKKKVFETAFN